MTLARVRASGDCLVRLRFIVLGVVSTTISSPFMGRRCFFFKFLLTVMRLFDFPVFLSITPGRRIQ